MLTNATPSMTPDESDVSMGMAFPSRHEGGMITGMLTPIREMKKKATAINNFKY